MASRRRVIGSMKPCDVKVEDLARETGCSVGMLWRISNAVHRQYQTPKAILVKEKSREIDVPKRRFKYQLRAIHRYLSPLFEKSGIVHGGAKGRSCFTAARAIER